MILMVFDFQGAGLIASPGFCVFCLSSTEGLNTIPKGKNQKLEEIERKIPTFFLLPSLDITIHIHYEYVLKTP